MSDEAAIRSLYWPEESAGPISRARERARRLFPPVDPPETREFMGRLEIPTEMPGFQAERGPITFAASERPWVSLEEAWERTRAAMTRSFMAQNSTAEPEPSLEDGIGEPLRPRGVVLTCEEHQEDAEDYEGCPVCNEREEETRSRAVATAQEAYANLVRAANQILQVWGDLDTSTAPIPRHFRVRMENAAANLRAART